MFRDHILFKPGSYSWMKRERSLFVSQAVSEQNTSSGEGRRVTKICLLRFPKKFLEDAIHSSLGENRTTDFNFLEAC